jgi:hypothetical protein
MAGAKQLGYTRFILVPAGAVRPAGVCSGTVLHCTVVLTEGATSMAGEKEKPPGP